MAPMLNPHFNNTLFFGSVSPLWMITLSLMTTLVIPLSQTQYPHLVSMVLANPTYKPFVLMPFLPHALSSAVVLVQCLT